MSAWYRHLTIIWFTSYSCCRKGDELACGSRLEIRNDASLASIDHPSSLIWDRLAEDRKNSSDRISLQALYYAISAGIVEHHHSMRLKQGLIKSRTHDLAN